MRLLSITTSYPLRAGASAGVFVQNLYRHLPSGWTVDVVCPADTQPSPGAVEESGRTSGPAVRAHAVRYAPAPWRTLAQGSGGIVPALRRAPWRLALLPAMLGAMAWRCFVLAGQADLIHANWSVCGMLAGFAGRLRGKPVVTTLRGSDVARAASSRIDSLFLSAAVRFSTTLVCVSTAMAAALRERFPARAADIHVGMNGADEAFFKTARPPSGPTLRILAVGSLVRNKGFDILVEALALAVRRASMHVTLVGAGPERDALQTLAAACGVSGLIEFAGPVAPPAMPARYAAADLFVLSSRSEGRPNVVLEALASGLPVISTDLAAVDGMVLPGDTGWRVPIADAQALAAILDQAAMNPAMLRLMGLRAREIARTRLGTWEDTARTYAALFQSAAGLPASTPAPIHARAAPVPSSHSAALPALNPQPQPVVTLQSASTTPPPAPSSRDAG